MKVGVYTGTFNPIHIGHLIVIIFAIENHNLDLLYVVPNKYPVHKKRKHVIEPETRLKMIELSIQNLIYKNRIKVSDFEIKNPLDSYTFYTIEHFRNIHPSDQIFYIVGLDSLLFYYWHNFELIYKLIDKFVVINTLGIESNLLDFLRNKLKELYSLNKEYNSELLNMIEYNYEGIEEKFLLLNMPIIKISSSLIWERLESGKAIDYMVNEKVKLILYKMVALKQEETL